MFIVTEYAALMMYCDCLSVMLSLSFFGVPLSGLQCVIVVFPDHTHLLLLRLVKQTDWKTWCSCSLMQKVMLLE